MSKVVFVAPWQFNLRKVSDTVIRKPVEDFSVHSFSSKYVEVNEPHFEQSYHDPLKDAYFWNDGDGDYATASAYTRRSFHESELRNRFWDRREVLDWLETNCMRNVLVQSGLGDYWSFLFLDGADIATEFDQFVRNSQREVMFRVAASKVQQAELYNWIEENVHCRFEFTPGSSVHFVYIKDVPDATLFKFRWGDDFAA